MGRHDSGGEGTGAPGDVTLVLEQVQRGEPGAAEKLMPLVYDELRARARRLMTREGRGHTLQPTALVHEAWLKLVDQTRADWKGRAHFLAVATTVMRRLLVDHARRRDAQRRGGEVDRVTLDERLDLAGGRDGAAGGEGGGIAVLDLDAALERLAGIDERRAEVAAYHLFGGLEPREIAEVMKVSRRTAERDWRAARAWLVSELAA